ncbi:hypothetical protein [Arcticibacter sp. MXS-1]|uniref:hypothetical protein n=1 Tax=Arcticibacter sp. MXS-1 TaxID=3341726 RepID=UPI0035A89F08
MIEKENFPMEDDEIQGQDDQSMNDTNPLSLEEQEQLNDANLVERIEEENEDSGDYDDIDASTTEPSEGEEDLQTLTSAPVEGRDEVGGGSGAPVTRNQLGDNPPGSEQAAFDAGNAGDMSSDQAKYQDQNIAENFRENLDKASREIDLDKRLKDNE